MSVCGVCGSQSVEFKQGISKKTGRPWKAYDCNDCKNEKGYPTRTFAFSPKSQSNDPTNSPNKPVGPTLEQKLDEILVLVRKLAGEPLKAKLDHINQELQVESEETPF